MRLEPLLNAVRVMTATAITGAFMATAIPAVVPHTNAAEATSSGTVTARTALNIRSTPDTNKGRIGVVYAGHRLKVRGTSVNGWTPVTFNGRDAWVSSQYVAQQTSSGTSAGPSTPPPTASAPTGSSRTTANLNVRRGPGLGQSIIRTLPRGTTVQRTGQISGDWTQINHRGTTAWVSSRYLTNPASTSAPTPPAPVISQPEPAPAPRTTGSRWGTVRLNLWNESSGTRYVEEAPTHTEFHITGKVRNGRAEVVWKGASRWVTARYLATQPPARAGSSGQCRASYYNTGAVTANGERYQPMGITAAHRNMPFNSRVRVTNLANGKSVVVRVNDRGPFVGDRCLDLSQGAFQHISPLGAGVIRVEFQVLDR